VEGEHRSVKVQHWNRVRKRAGLVVVECLGGTLEAMNGLSGGQQKSREACLASTDTMSAFVHMVLLLCFALFVCTEVGYFRKGTTRKQ
jgi:hypothetical protein